ncbi:MAG TPA: GNAT family N-acetyltransferase [Anaerolineales bacterium]|nr:GNAT family N-acetyltransferase [Anaerolineales bacterium]
MKTEYRPFTSEMIPEAGELLAKRHTCNRRMLPLLPARFEDTHVAAKAVEDLWQAKYKNGYAAFRNGKMTAYLIGDFEDTPWARSGYVYLHGYALADGESLTVVQDLYALLGEDWVQRGIFSHNMYISAADKEVIQGLFTIGLGMERVDGLLDLRTLEIPKLDVPQTITIRRAGNDDSDRAGSVAYVMLDALGSAPYWLPIVPEAYDDFKERWSRRVDGISEGGKEWAVWMALEQDQAVGTVAFFKNTEQEYEVQMLLSPHTIYLATAVTKPEVRNHGIANILTWRGLEEARREGFEICLVNWVTPNLLASRYWPRFGFQEVAYRLSKQVNPMTTWAKPEGPSSPSRIDWILGRERKI